MSDKRSLYFDPLLLEAISKLTQQMRRRLSNDLKDRSIKVLSLSANKLLIDTRKKTFEPAREYFNYLQELVASIDLYKDIDIGSEPKFWRFIMFQNSQKYSGLQHGEVHFDQPVAIRFCVERDTAAAGLFQRTVALRAERLHGHVPGRARKDCATVQRRARGDVSSGYEAPRSRWSATTLSS